MIRLRRTLLVMTISDLVTTIRGALVAPGDWAAVAERVGTALSRDLPPAALVPGPASGVLHIEHDGSFSVVAMVLNEGQATSIHDHVTWCAFAVLAGEPDEEQYTLQDGALVPTRREACPRGTVSGGAPPGDIHRVTNPHAEPAISLHVYGTDVSRIGSSVRRIYDR